MPVLSETQIIRYLEKTVALQTALLPLLEGNGTARAGGSIMEEYAGFIASLESHRNEDTYLADEAWNWIFKKKKSFNYLQLYGRLSWINLQLFDLM